MMLDLTFVPLMEAVQDKTPSIEAFRHPHRQGAYARRPN